jgi:putative NIF3 family GTP cyclohydrolase 1 type 2
MGTFRPGSNTNPAIGAAGGPREVVDETRIEVLVTAANRHAVVAAMKRAHPYEEVAYEVVALANEATEIGAGIIGTLPTPLTETETLQLIAGAMKAPCIRHTRYTGAQVTTIALCGGSGSFLLRDAIAAGAQVFLTADFKYHQFFDAEDRIMIADIGHYESEQYTSEIFETILKNNFPNFAVLLSNLSTNPVKYFC